MSAPIPNAAPFPNTAPLPVTVAASLPTITPLPNIPIPSPMPPKLGQTKNKNILHKYTPHQKMKFLAWRRLNSGQIKNTMFENITLNEDNIQLDITILDELWSRSKSKKKVRKPVKSKNDEQKSTANEGREFLGGMWLRRCICAVLFRFNKLKDPKDIKSVNDVINDIKNVEEIQEINYLDKITKALPYDDEMKEFKNHPKILQLKDMNESRREVIVNKFPFLERFWCYFTEIPGSLKRCRLQMLRLEFEEFCPFEYENIKLLQSMCTRLYNNDQICKVLELVLNIGNYLNYPRIMKGCSLDTFSLLKYSRSNRDQMYSLLIYLVEMVNDNYPELANWVELFDDVRTHDLNRMKIQFDHMHSSLNDFRNFYVLNNQMQKIMDKMDSDFQEIETEFRKTVTECHALAKHLGTDTNITIAEDFVNFCKMLINIKTDWKAAQHLVERAKNIYIALVCGFIRESENNLLYKIPVDIIWWIYVYFPRWSLSSISKFLELHKYQLNQYIDTVSNRLPFDENKIYFQHKPSRKMKPLQWEKISITNTIFEKIEQHKQNVCLDFQLLEELWSKDVRRNRKVVPKNATDKNFAVFEQERSANRAFHFRFMAQLLFKNNPKGLRDFVLDMETNEVKDIVRLRTMLLLVPTEKEMEWFRDVDKIKTLTHVKNVDAIVCKFPLAEQLWFYCMDIPLILKRCELQLLKLEVDEFYTEQYETIKFLHGVYNKLYNNSQIHKISELVLFIGNYLNYSHRSFGNAMGFSWVVFIVMKKFTALRANNGNYSLLMYLVDMVDKYYPELTNWVDAFDDVEKCLNFDLDEISFQIKNIFERIDGYREKGDEIKDESKENLKLNERMKDTLHEIGIKMDNVNNDLTEAVHLCDSLSGYFGLGKPIWRIYFTTLIDIKNDWKELQRKMEKPIKTYKNIVNAYCLKFGYRFENDTVSLQIINTIYLYLSSLFRCDLVSMYLRNKTQKKKRLYE